MKRVIIIHGWESRGAEGWRPWLKKELEREGFAVQLPDMPNSKNPILEEWLEAMRELIGTPDEETHLIGHSLGATAILRYLASLSENERIGVVIPVAGFFATVGVDEVQNFIADPFNWKAIEVHAKHIALIHSDNDRYVPLDQGIEMQKQLGSELHVMPNAGHFSSHEGYTELPIVRDTFLRLVSL